MPESLVGGLIVALVAGLLWRSRGALSWEPERPRIRMTHGGVLQRAKPAVPPAKPLPMTYRYKVPEGPAFIFVDTEDTAEAARALALHPLFYPESVA